MKKIKTTIILLAIVALFSACKKENTLKQAEPKDYKIANMKMNYYGKVLEYTVKYSPSTNTRKVEGNDAIVVQKLIDSFPNSVTLFVNKTEIFFFKDKPDYYYYINKIYGKVTLTNSLIGNQLGTGTQNTDFWFYRDAFTNNLIISDNINTLNSPKQLFIIRQPCNDGTSNSCPYASQYYVGKRVSWVGGNNNDCISSIRLKNNVDNGYGGAITITLFQDADFGGKAIALYFSQSSINDQVINQLSIYKINTLFKTWNDRTSSYECFYPF